MAALQLFTTLPFSACVFICASVGLICRAILPSPVNSQRQNVWRRRRRRGCQVGAATATEPDCTKKKTRVWVKKTHVHTWRSRAHQCAGACEKQLPPPLREHRKLETMQRLHAGFSSKLVLSAAACLRAGPATRLDPQHIRQAGYL